MNRRIEQLRALSLRERWLLPVVAFLLPTVALLLWFTGYNRTKSLMGRFIVKGRFEETDKSALPEVQHIARMVTVAARHGPYRANCLKQSLVLWWLLARCGISSEIKFGIQQESERFPGAHAWVEYAGVTLIDSQEFHQRISSFG